MPVDVMPARETRKHILLVDDDRGFLEVTQIILRREGYDVATAPTGREALDSAGEKDFNAVVLDISLPDADGTELLSRLLEKSPALVPIMLTGRSSVRNAIDSLNHGAFAYLEKPVEPRHLLSVIKQGLEKQRLIVERGRLLEELERSNRETRLLLRVSRAVARSLNPERIIAAALDALQPDMGEYAIHVNLAGDNYLKLAGQYGLSDMVKTALNAVPVEAGVAGAVFRNGLSIEAAPGSEDGEIPPALAGEGYRCYAVVPLTAGGERLGVMGFASRLPVLPRTLDTLAAVAHELSIAIRNSQLYEEASSARALRELDAMRSKLLANVSHQLRAPLAVIKGYASSLLQTDVTFDIKTLQEFLVAIDQEADRLARLIDEMLLMCRIEKGALELRRDYYAVRTVVESVTEPLANLTLRHRLCVDIAPGLAPVYVDIKRIGEALVNLVENAAKYSPEGTDICLAAGQDADRVVFTVSDQGCGIPPECREKVFERFYRVPDPAVQARPGTGLGLSICRGIVRAHGGEISVRGQPGGGSEFSFFLPRGEQRSREAAWTG
ncbi:MAG: response regulator [Chloroflexi bacterium]|nr:response regulator [Chloroflexota bacterium]